MINSISVLFVTRDPDLAGQIIGRIRYRGHAVRPKQAGNARDLERLLQSHRFDAVVLIDAGLDIGLAAISEALHRAGRQTPVVLVSDHGQEQSLRAIDSGVFAVVDRKSDDLAAVMTLRAVEYLNKGRELTQLRTLLREADRRYLLMMDSSRYPIACFHEGAATYANEPWREFFEMDLSESIDGLNISDLVIDEQREDLAHILAELRNQPENVETYETLTVRTRRGRTFDADLLLTTAVINGEPCTVVHLSAGGDELALQGPAGLGIPSGAGGARLEQIGPSETAAAAPAARPSGNSGRTESPAAGAEPRRARPASTASAPRPDDAASERQFLHEVDTQLAETAQSGRTLAVLVFVPDALQPDQGSRSEVPGSEIPQLLKRHFPATAKIARLRQGRHAVALASPNRSELDKTLGSLLKASRELQIPLGDGASIRGPLSCGGVLADDSGPEAGELLQHCLEALEEARAAGGQQFRFHLPQGGREADQKADLTWKERIEGAVRDNRLLLLFQPIVSLGGEDVPRYSVFVRLTGEDGSTYEPDDFMPPAERTGVAASLDRWVIQQAVAMLSQQMQRDDRTVFFLKLSQGALDGEPVADWLRRYLDRHKVQPKQVVIEFKEAALLTRLDQATAVARGMRAMGAGLCVADFGNALEPFRILEHVDAAYIRLDGSFVARLAHDATAQDTVRHLTKTAQSMDRQVIIPMVEDADTLTALFSMDVNLVQGYFVQPPSEQLDFDFASGL